jgi:hypothetical protein
MNFFNIALNRAIADFNSAIARKRAIAAEIRVLPKDLSFLSIKTQTNFFIF